MLNPNSDVRLTNYLTQFLKKFKTLFHLQLCLIQLISNQSDQIYEQIQRIYTAKSAIQAQIYTKQDITQILITKQSWKTLERFYMRINEYIEYRIMKTRNLKNTTICLQIEKLSKSFKQLFTQMNKEIQSKQFTLQSVFRKLDRLSDNHTFRILQKITSNDQINQFNSHATQALDKMIKQQKIKQLEQRQKQGNYDETKQSDSSETSNKRQRFLYKKSYIKHERILKTRSRRTTIQSLIKIYEQPKQSDYEQLSSTEGRNVHVKIRKVPTQHSQKNIGSYSSYVGGVVQLKPFQIYGNLLDLDLTEQRRPNKKNLLTQLTELNKKNDIVIKQYLKRIKKKKDNRSKNLMKIFERQPQLLQKFQKQNSKSQKQAKHKRTLTLDVDRKLKRIQNQSLRKQLMKLPIIKTTNKIK